MLLRKEQLARSAVTPPGSTCCKTKRKCSSCGNIGGREDNFPIFCSRTESACFCGGFAPALGRAAPQRAPAGGRCAKEHRAGCAAVPDAIPSQPRVPAERGRLSVPGAPGPFTRDALFLRSFGLKQVVALVFGFLFFPFCRCSCLILIKKHRRLFSVCI